MFNEQPVLIIPEARLVEQLRPEHIEVHSELATPSPEQVAAANGVFAQDHEAQQMANVMGIWGSAVLLQHVIAEPFHMKDEEEEEEKRRRAQLLERPGPQES